MNFSRRGFIKVSGYSIAAACAGWYGISNDTALPVEAKGRVIKLFNGRNLDGWYSFLRSHGKNSDPEGIFKVEDKMIHVLGKEFGYLSTTSEHDNFHLTIEFKWGREKVSTARKSQTR